MKLFQLVMAVVVSLAFACDQDPFHLHTRPIRGGYGLEKWEDGTTYYIVRDDAKNSGGGVLDGTVLRVGWNDRYIVAERKANFAGDKDGWMIIETSSGAIRGPFAEAELKKQSEVRDVALMPSPQAWQRLR